MKIIQLVTGELAENCYIVLDDKTAVIIDSGDDFESIAEVINDNKATDINILLTHGHFDHCGACEQLQNEFNAKIYISKDDYNLIINGLSLGEDFNKPVKTFKVEQFVTDKQILKFNSLRFEVIATPGHTLGGVCYLIKDNLFSGDTLFFMGVGRTDFPTGNAKQLQSSIINKLFILDDSVKVYCGHDRATTIGTEKANNPYV